MTAENVERYNQNRIEKKPELHWFKRIIANSHTLFFALFPPISLYAINISRYPGNHIFRSLLILVLSGTALLFIGWIILREIERAAVFASLTLFFSMNYGHVYSGLSVIVSRLSKTTGVEFSLNDVSVGAHIVLSLIWIVLLFIVYRQITRKPDWMQVTPQYLLLVALIGLVVPSIRIGWEWGKINSAIASSEIHHLDVELPSDQELGRPDVFYILLDGYGREDILTEFYNYDNSEFLEGLAEKGFFIASKSRSNYSNTITSLASSINMKYLEEIEEGLYGLE